MMNNFWLFIVAVLLAGCVSLKSPHERFLINMDITISYNETIAELERYSRFAMREYLVSIEKLDEAEKYHYKKPMLWEGYCYYHLAVNSKTKKVVGWGFDDQLGDPKVCGNSG